MGTSVSPWLREMEADEDFQAGAFIHSFPLPLNLSLLAPFRSTSVYFVPHMNQINPWMWPQGAQDEL